MMPFLLAELAHLDNMLPLYVRCVGSHEQKRLDRAAGYEAHQLLLSRRGTGVFRFHGRPDVRLPAGSILFLPARTPHSYYPDASGDAWDLGFVAFEGDAAPLLLERVTPLQPLALQPALFESLWERLESLWSLLSLNGEQAYWEASRRLYDLLLIVLEGQASSRRGARNERENGQPNSALQTAVRLIHDHIGERLLISNVARAAGYSVQHFHRLFVARYGMTPHQYILQLRMRRSAQLLQDGPGLSVEEVARQLGMETSYFIRMFKRVYGRTPKQYAKG